jgi:SAM-dependent methyltransferase
MSTDQAWERWGTEDAYFGVLTNPMFRRAAMTPEAHAEFFRSGENHVSQVLETCRLHLDPAFVPRRVLDFGCGVGRLLIGFAQAAQHVVGVDVSASMLVEAQRNCTALGANNVVLLPSDDTLSAVEGSFDLVHSCIVLQHIEIERGRLLFKLLVERVQPGGIGALHVTFGLDQHAATFGQPPPPSDDAAPVPAGPLGQVKSQLRRTVLEPLGLRRPPATAAPTVVNPDPEMQMNFYNLSELMFILQRAGVSQVHTELTDHGGAMGAFLFFRRP